MHRQKTATTPADPLQKKAESLKFYGLLAHWDTYRDAPWLAELLEREAEERKRRSLERRLRNARIGRFKPIADFDWAWPSQVDRDLVEELLTLRFIEEKANVVLIGPNGVGKTTIARNIAYQAVLAGHTVRSATAASRALAP